METLRKGTGVEWSYGKGKAEGKVAEVFKDKVTRKIKGKSITREASKEEPAYLVTQEGGDKALKSGSELTKKH